MRSSGSTAQGLSFGQLPFGFAEAPGGAVCRTAQQGSAREDV